LRSEVLPVKLPLNCYCKLFKMSERIRFSNNIIWQEAGKNGITVKELEEDLMRLLDIQKELDEKKLPLLLIFDASDAKTADSGVRKQAIKNMNSINYHKVAVFGVKSTYLKYMANFVILGMGKADKVKIFDTKEEAEKWVRS
jgi:hypothetical protein